MKHPDTRIIVFAKAPVAGRAKTRLIPALGASAAAALHGRLVEHTLAWSVAARLAPVQLHCAPDVGHPLFVRCASRFGIELRDQQGDGLGERMYHALVTALEGAERVLLVGSDCPWMDAGYLGRAIEVLGDGEGEAVVGPAEDGGYVLVGLRRPRPELFHAIPWGGAEVLARTRDRAVAAGIRLHELEPLPDLDRPEDLARLKVDIPDLLSGLL